MRNFLRSKTGSFSIIFLILCVIGIIIITGFVDLLGKTLALNEVQSIMDVAGTSALQAGVDENKLRAEKFRVEESFVKNAFRAQVYSLVPTDGYNIKGITIDTDNMVITYINDAWGLGDSARARPQVVFDTVAKVKIRSSYLFDTVPGVSEQFYRSLSNSNFTVTYNGRTSDGYTELIIRSVVRMVYR